MPKRYLTAAPSALHGVDVADAEVPDRLAGEAARQERRDDDADGDEGVGDLTVAVSSSPGVDVPTADLSGRGERAQSSPEAAMKSPADGRRSGRWV
jgi:hypothetical protein